MAVVIVAGMVGGVLVACSGSDTTNDLGGTRPGTSTGGTDSGRPGTASDGSIPGTDAAPEAPPPTPSGCITDVTPGDHTFTCEGLQVDVSIPALCTKPGCGLITEIHGDTGTGALMDANTNLKALGKQRGFVVVAPSGPPWPGGPGSTWRPSDDETVVKIIQKVAQVFRTDPKKNHVTGFSRGGFVTWRLLCKHADMFASVAPGTAGSSVGTSNGFSCSGVNEVSCPFDAAQPDGMPSVEVPILFLIGRTDTPVPLGCTSRIRAQAIAAMGTQHSVRRRRRCKVHALAMEQRQGHRVRELRALLRDGAHRSVGQREGALLPGQQAGPVRAPVRCPVQAAERIHVG